MTESVQAINQRDTILLCHANPEDNEFTRWLALQLANEGYRVWCDLTKLLGGEVFWDNIEEVIKTHVVKVLYVLSRTSNAKDGPLKELHFAQGIAKREKLTDFVIPLHIDDLPHGEVTIEITRINSSAQSWDCVRHQSFTAVRLNFGSAGHASPGLTDHLLYEGND